MYFYANMFHYVIKPSNMWLLLIKGSEYKLETEIFYKKLGHNLRCIRKQHGVTQEELGKQLGLTKSAIVNYETGIRKIPFDVLVKFSDCYNIEIKKLYKNKKTLSDVINSKIGKTELTEQQEELLINYIEILLGSEK